LALAVALLCGNALPTPAWAQGQPPLGPRVVLVGDSTIAPRSGYGNALCAHLQQVACLNLARGGRSSMSYRAEGLWDTVLTLLRERGPGDTRQKNLMLIQFGHNDQPGKPGRSTDLATEFGPNLARFVAEVHAEGAEVLLITPLTRRSFKDGVLLNDLRPWAEATLRLGAELNVPVLDLNASSSAAVQAMGPETADTLAEAPPRFDRTHLGPKGAALFAQQVLDGLLTLKPELASARTLR
jgi:lysophospholipase L1-like esterase